MDTIFIYLSIFAFFIVALGAILVTPMLVRVSCSNFLRDTYIFWVIVSFYNLPLLFILDAPILFFIKSVSDYFSKFYEFLLPVIKFTFLSVVLIFGGLTIIFPIIYKNNFSKKLLPFIFNLFILIVFLLSGNFYKNYLINKVLKKHKPECVQINSFLSSLSHAGQESQFSAHALFKENGKNYYWSYSKLDFFEGNKDLDINFICKPKN